MGVMNKDRLSRGVAAKTGLSIRRSREMVQAVIDVLGEALDAGDDVRISHLGTFVVVEEPARMVRNPRTKTVVHAPARRWVRFRVSRTLMADINKQ